MSLPPIFSSTIVLKSVQDNTPSLGSSLGVLSGLANVQGSLGLNPDEEAILAMKHAGSKDFFKVLYQKDGFKENLMAYKSYNPSNNENIYDEAIYNQETKQWLVDPLFLDAHKRFTTQHFIIIQEKVGGFVNITIDSTETAGFSLAALTFLGLSYTFRSGEHIRVTLVTRLLNKEIKRYQELFSLSFSLLITGFLMYWSWDFVYFSFVFDEISPGLLAIPFWIPRISMSIGVTIFFIALLDDIVMVLKNKIPSYVKNADPIFKDNA